MGLKVMMDDIKRIDTKYLSVNDWSKNIITFKCIEINKTDGALYNVKGNILFRLNNIEKAIENWQKAKDLGYKIELMDKKIRDKSLYE